MNEWMNEWINQSINQLMNQWINERINELITTCTFNIQMFYVILNGQSWCYEYICVLSHWVAIMMYEYNVKQREKIVRTLSCMRNTLS